MALKKVYDFPYNKVQSQVISAFRKNQRQGTVADVISVTGLPKYQVETVLPAVVNDCRGQMKVTDSGEILYHFPKGMARQSQASKLKQFVNVLAKVGAFLFKIWIVVMLVGYFLLFVLLILVALVASIALSASRRDDRDSGDGLLGMFAVSRLVEFVLLLWLYSGDPVVRKQKKTKPFYKAVFEFVFGSEPQPEAWGKMERKAVISWAQRNKGLVTLEELMAMTGKSREDANSFVSRLLLEYEGEPQVSDRGTLYYAFPTLMKTSQESREYRLPEEDLIPFTRNPASTNRWIVFFNGFNAVLSVYFLSGSLGWLNPHEAISIVYQVALSLGVSSGASYSGVHNLVFWILGIVPALYSLLFFGIPGLRRLNERRENLLIKLRNFRRKVVARILARPKQIELTVEPDSERNASGHPGQERQQLQESILREVADQRPVEVIGEAPHFYFAVPELEAEQFDLDKIRAQVDPSKFSLGKVVFDSGSSEPV
ncbi:MAG: hypothetical protein HKM05_03665 [Spirochaetales bacterium]|nr:hypothetical protein [Spirochaetales bacterium]